MSEDTVRVLSIDGLIDFRREVLDLASEGDGLIAYTNMPLDHYQFFSCSNHDELISALRDVRVYMLDHLPTLEVKAAFWALNLTNASPETTLMGRMELFLDKEEERLMLFTVQDVLALARDGFRTIAMFFDTAQHAVGLQRELDLMSEE